MLSSFFITSLAMLSCTSTSAFAPHWNYAEAKTRDSVVPTSFVLDALRRDFMESILVQTCALGSVASLAVASPRRALASGGATAGGAYLLSAKQRYNERVKTGVLGFLGLESAIEAGDFNAVRPYFTSEDAGNWKDLTSAGYLLANAFRRNSTAAPDSLPSVKAWKKFAASVEGLTKAFKKKDTKGAVAAYNEALSFLDEYLKQVELPVSKEISVA